MDKKVDNTIVSSIINLPNTFSTKVIITSTVLVYKIFFDIAVHQTSWNVMSFVYVFLENPLTKN